MKKMYKINTLIIFVFLVLVLSSCFENELLPSGGDVTPAELVIVATDEEGEPIAGATVNVYGNLMDYLKEENSIGTSTTDSEGKAVFGKDILGEEGGRSFYIDVHSDDYSVVNWDNTNSSPRMLLTAGQTVVTTPLTAPIYSDTITGESIVVSGSSSSFSVIDYPGTYSWSVDSDNASIDDPTSPSIRVSFEQNTEADETITLTLDYSVGTESGTITLDILSTQFCTFDETIWPGLSLGGSDPCWGLNVSDPTGDGVILDGMTMTFPADDSGNPYFFNNLFASWGEQFQPEFGSEGDVVLSLSEDGSFVIEEQYLGQTVAGTDVYDYWVVGSGTFDQCNNTITLETWDLSYDEFESAFYGSASGCTSPWVISE